MSYCLRFFNRISLLPALLVIVIAALSLSCAAKPASTTVTQQMVTVQKGTLRIDVTATGNLELSQTADLAFDVSGYVYRVLVEEGDQVEKGQVVADVDSFDWEKQKRSYERAVVSAQVSVNNAQIALEKAQNPTTTTSTISGSVEAPDPLDIETKQLQLNQAKMSLEDAQKELDRYLQTSYQIVAPFNGFVTKVNVKGGDEIYKGAIALSIADPNKFETSVLVSEMDINKIKVGMTANVQTMASSTSVFPSKVTAISPTATNESGVVNYKVKVELLSEDEIKQLTATQTQVNQPLQPGQPSSGQSPQSTQPQSTQSTTKSATGSSMQSTPLTLEELRDGLSVTVSIIIQEKPNVLMVLSRAISKQGTDSIVRVVTGETTETRVVKTGITNTQYTEITEGVSESEQVAIMTTATSTTTQSTSSQSMQMPGMGMGGGAPPSGGGPPP